MRNIRMKSNLARRESVKETEEKGQRQEGIETTKYNIVEAKIKKKRNSGKERRLGKSSVPN